MLIALSAVSLVLFIAAKYYYVWRNKQNATVWDRMNGEERERYVAENSHRGNKRYLTITRGLCLHRC